MGERGVVDCSILLWRHLDSRLEVELSSVRCRRRDFAAEGRPSPLDIPDFGGVLNVPTVMIDAMAGMERAGTQVEGAPPVSHSCPATSIAGPASGGLRPKAVTEIWRQQAGEVGRTARPGGGAGVLEQDTGLTQACCAFIADGAVLKGSSVVCGTGGGHYLPLSPVRALDHDIDQTWW
jgi:hypothetical protein